MRYGDILLPKGLPRGGYTELDLAQTNYLRELVELTPETSSKVAVEKDRRRLKANQIRRAVKRHSQTSANPRQGNNSNRRFLCPAQQIINGNPIEICQRDKVAMIDFLIILFLITAKG